MSKNRRQKESFHFNEEFTKSRKSEKKFIRILTGNAQKKYEFIFLQKKMSTFFPKMLFFAKQRMN